MTCVERQYSKNCNVPFTEKRFDKHNNNFENKA